MKKLHVAIYVILSVLLTASLLYAQTDEQNPPVPAAPAPAVAAPVPAAPGTTAEPAESPKSEELSIYGEVQSVNPQANSMVVQYYDYDNDAEKSMEITLDKDTKLENVTAIGDIKKADWVDVTYTVNAGKNMAKFVSVEKEEPSQEQNAPDVAQQ